MKIASLTYTRRTVSVLQSQGRKAVTKDNRSPGGERYAAVAISALLLLAVAMAVVFYIGQSGTTSSTTSTTSSSTAQAESVSVFGLVSTTGAGTHPLSMVFTSLTTHGTFSASVSSGRFSTQLPNHDTYNVTMNWAGNFTWQHGQAASGTLSLNMSAGSNMAQSYNQVLPTPDSIVAVNGTIPWQAVTSSPVGIRFTATDGENFTTAVSANHTFSLRLPNVMNYEVYIQSRNSTGNEDWYYAHTLGVSAGVNVIGLEVRISY